MGYWDKVGCRLNMEINPETEQKIPFIIHAISHTMDNHRHLRSFDIYSIALSNTDNKYFC